PVSAINGTGFAVRSANVTLMRCAVAVEPVNATPAMAS
ncbi:hypothetical protein D030_2119B, partial [Vibrio parahaemolyticus AQ3810]